MHQYDNDVAISFAGEQRAEARAIADCLKHAGIKVFFDEDKRADSWGRDLVEYFTEVFHTRARYCVMLISASYVDKMWTQLERQAALARALVERSEYILPIRFDETPIPGLAPTVAYVHYEQLGAEGICTLVQQKLNKEQAPLQRLVTEAPQLSPRGTKVRHELSDRLLSYSLRNSQEFQLMQGQDLLAPVCAPPDIALDFICSILRTTTGQTCLLLPSAASTPGPDGVGRTALLTRLFGFRLPYTHYVPTHKVAVDHVHQKGTVQDEVVPPPLNLQLTDTGGWRLAAADMAYLTVIDGELCAIPTGGERALLVWDLIRHLYRCSKLNYRSGDQHTAAGLAWRERLLNHTCVEGLTSIYDRPRIYHIDHVVSLRREHSGALAVTAEPLSPDEGLFTMTQDLLMSSAKHPAEFWDRPDDATRAWVDGLTQRVLRSRPYFHTIRIQSPAGASVPHLMYDWVCEALANCVQQQRYRKSLEELTSKRGLIIGIDAHNALLFEALPSARRVTMIVTTGKKVFDDIALWRYASDPHNPTQLQIALLDPTSPEVDDIQRTDYKDKPEGFVKQELLDSIEAIKHVQSTLGTERLQYALTPHRPAFRMTIIDNARVIAAPYLPGLRTGQSTVFVDLHEHEMTKVIEAYCRYSGDLLRTAQ